ncbi:MAG TPA: AIR synthase-related protein [Ferruginibacter sp.]|nr:AIR synthase-related protein [Ferruginibacter sp.]HRO05749.1 AIR synthase-related protein [Ferruginibacter sp.]HRO95957.1 AIR synthase-related protein [Ferruginibacter sp.]HRP48706.1 AIR synthase-related protein [Ferruginibacter sp.]
MSLYNKRGVSAQKEEVHQAVAKLHPGLYPKAFCKIYPDYQGKDEQYVNVMHADGAGTKSILAYLYWKETGDLSVWKGIAQDAVVMNLDDLLCVGICDDILFNSTIDRNKHLIPGEVLETIINGTQDVFNTLATFGINIHYLGGETADVGDVVRTIAVNGTMASRWPVKKLITNERIQAGDVIVGLAGFGKTSYESEYNSGIGSNGLTSARHDMLSNYYGKAYPESYNPVLDDSVAYIGSSRLTDTVTVEDGSQQTIGKLLLSPTRTFAPLMKVLLTKYFDEIHGMVHCSGGGQTKCMKYLPAPFSIIKDNLFEPPAIFKLIQESSGSSHREMYEVFNMGTRMEIYCSKEKAPVFIEEAEKLGIAARIVGRVEAGSQKLMIQQGDVEIVY